MYDKIILNYYHKRGSQCTKNALRMYYPLFMIKRREYLEKCCVSQEFRFFKYDLLDNFWDKEHLWRMIYYLKAMSINQSTTSSFLRPPDGALLEFGIQTQVIPQTLSKNRGVGPCVRVGE